MGALGDDGHHPDESRGCGGADVFVTTVRWPAVRAIWHDGRLVQLTSLRNQLRGEYLTGGPAVEDTEGAAAVRWEAKPDREDGYNYDEVDRRAFFINTAVRLPTPQREWMLHRLQELFAVAGDERHAAAETSAHCADGAPGDKRSCHGRSR